MSTIITARDLIEVHGKVAADAIHTALDVSTFSPELHIYVNIGDNVHLFGINEALDSIEDYFGTSDLF